MSKTGSKISELNMTVSDGSWFENIKTTRASPKKF